MRQRSEGCRQRGHRQVVVVGAGGLILIGFPVPVASQAQHTNVHLATATDDWYVGRHRPVHQGTALLDERPLPVDRQIVRQVKGAGGNLHFLLLTSYFYLTDIRFLPLSSLSPAHSCV